MVTQIAAHGKQQQSFSLPLRHIAPGDLPSGSPLEVLAWSTPRKHMTDALVRRWLPHERVTVHVDITSGLALTRWPSIGLAVSDACAAWNPADS